MVTAFWTEFDRDVVTVSGADASSYLQGQISQDIRNLAVGESTFTFVLEPTGKVDSLARITRVADEQFRLDTDAGFGEQLLARLKRFKIRVDVEVELGTTTAVAVRGVPVPAGASPAWGRDDAFDLLGGTAPAGIRQGSSSELLAARIEAGWPAMGHEITEATIPAETGITAHAVSFTKGCYPGQELVERMDSRGSTAPRLVRRLRGEGTVAAGDEVLHGGKVVGALTSVAETDEGWVALALVARSVQSGDEVTVHGAASVVEDIAVPANS